MVVGLSMTPEIWASSIPLGERDQRVLAGAALTANLVVRLRCGTHAPDAQHARLSWSGSPSPHLSCWRRTRRWRLPQDARRLHHRDRRRTRPPALPSTPPRTVGPAAGQKWPSGDAAGAALSKLTAGHEVVCRAPARDPMPDTCGSASPYPGFHAAVCSGPDYSTEAQDTRATRRGMSGAGPFRRALGLAARAPLTEKRRCWSTSGSAS